MTNNKILLLSAVKGYLKSRVDRLITEEGKTVNSLAREMGLNQGSLNSLVRSVDRTFSEKFLTQLESALLDLLGEESFAEEFAEYLGQAIESAPKKRGRKKIAA